MDMSKYERRGWSLHIETGKALGNADFAVAPVVLSHEKPVNSDTAICVPKNERDISSMERNPRGLLYYVFPRESMKEKQIDFELHVAKGVEGAFQVLFITQFLSRIPQHRVLVEPRNFIPKDKDPNHAVHKVLFEKEFHTKDSVPPEKAAKDMADDVVEFAKERAKHHGEQPVDLAWHDKYSKERLEKLSKELEHLRPYVSVMDARVPAYRKYFETAEHVIQQALAAYKASDEGKPVGNLGVSDKYIVQLLTWLERQVEAQLARRAA